MAGAETGCLLAHETGVRVGDGGIVSLAPNWGTRRLKALLLISQHPELDEANWSGRVEIHYGTGGIVKGAILPAATELQGF